MAHAGCRQAQHAHVSDRCSPRPKCACRVVNKRPRLHIKADLASSVLNSSTAGPSNSSPGHKPDADHTLTLVIVAVHVRNVAQKRQGFRPQGRTTPSVTSPTRSTQWTRRLAKQKSRPSLASRISSSAPAGPNRPTSRSAAPTRKQKFVEQLVLDDEQPVRPAPQWTRPATPTTGGGTAARQIPRYSQGPTWLCCLPI